MCSLSLMLCCDTLVTFLFALSKEDNLCLSEEKSQQSVLKSLCHPPRCSLWNCSTVEMSDGGFVLCPFPFFKTQQYNIGFSAMKHFCCCGIPSCYIFYAIPFLEKPWWRRRAPWAACPPRRCVAEVRGYQPWVCLCSLPGCRSPFSCSPLGL